MPTPVIEQQTGRYSGGSRKNEIVNGTGETSFPKRKLSGSWNSLFRNRFYLGEYVLHDQVYLNVYPALISKVPFDAVQANLTRREYAQP